MKENMNNLDDNEVDTNYIQGKMLSSPPPGEEIVISGIAGTFPNSNDIYQYQYNLFNKINMVLPNRRWEYVHPEIPVRSGTIPECDKYDAGFFGVHHMQAHAQEPMGRMMLEKVVEAIFDAGLSLSDFEGTNTGVYVGTCFSETEKAIFHDKFGPSASHGFTGCIRSTIAHRISYFLKLNGPSVITDTACSSSLFALETAFRDLRLGKVDSAIVTGSNMCFHPFVSLQFARLGVLSLDGSCKVFDSSGNGYARSEAVAVMILQKSKVAKRKYADIVYVKTNCDGFKEAGITYPSGDAQRVLLTEVYRDTGIDPAQLTYLEAHGTGTIVGDPEECAAIDEVLAKPRKSPLLIGSVKSNIGHSEPASGMCSIAKVIIGYETGYIGPNLHFNSPRDTILGIVEGRMKVVTEKTPLSDVKGFIGINSFGFGGGNCHILLKGNPNEKKNKGIPLDNIPRVTCISGRTEESIVTLLDEIKKTDLDAEFIRLLHNIYRKNVPNHLYRGYSITSKSGEICRFFGSYSGCKTPLYFVFGELNDWYKIGRDLLILKTFEETLKNAQRLLLSKGMDIMDTLFSDSEPIGKYQILGSILVQLGLTNIFKTLELQPTNYFGHSIGELVSAYFDGILTFKQIVDAAFLLNDVIDKTNDVFKKRQDTKSVSKTQMNGNLNTSTILSNFSSYLHSSEFTNTKKELLSNLSNILNKPQNQINGKEEKFGSADYFVNALTENFSAKFEYVESSSIILSFGALPQPATDLDDVKIIKLGISKDSNNLLQFLKILGNIYINGYLPQLAKLYPEVKFPVSRGTKMISPFIKWNHERTWFIPDYSLQSKASLQQGSRRLKLQVSDQQWNFVKGHVVDGRNLFPATGYLYLVWEALCLLEEMPMDVKHLIFQDCRFLRATNLPKKGNVIFEISVNRFSGKFEIIEGDSVVVRGRVTSHDIEEVEKVESISVQKELSMNSKDVYKELRLRGYNYSGGFRSIEKCSIDASAAFIKWENNWITFLDNLLQLKILQSDTRLLYVPTYIEYLRLPARDHLDWINNEFVNKNVEPILPVICNQYTGEISCGNIVIKGLIASSIARRKDFGVPVLESYQFVPNNMNFNLEESIRVNSQIVLENCLIKKVKVVELVDEFTKNETLLIPIMHTAFEDQPLIQPLSKILSKNTIETSIPIEDKELSTEVDCNVIIGTQLSSRTDVMKMAYTCLKDNGFIISREPLNFTESSIALEHFTVFTVHTTPAEIIILLKKNSKSKQLVTLNIESSDEEYLWLDTLKNIIKQKKSDNVLLYSQNEETSGLLGLVNCLRREPESGFIKCLLLLDRAEDFDTNKQFYKNQLQKNMAINIWKNGTWGTYRHLPLPELKQVKTEHCYINTIVRGDLASLRWIENTLNADTIAPPAKTLVKVQYAAINFRDVMTASGRINVDVITEDRLEQECTQGFEFSGVDTEGNRVMGMLDHGALSTLVLADNYMLFKVPDDYTLEEAATIPVVYGTVIYGMIIRGKLQKNEKVLIHSGTGGVGQAGIRLALHYGCEVFTTVGTEEKKEFLLKTFPQLKESNIGNSHDVSFEKMIIKGTNGQGVDMVLNSLADEKLLASVRCLGRGGRFIEIGKFDLANNTELNLLLLEKEASFHGVMLDNLICSPPDIKMQVTDILNANVKKFVVPLPTNVFGYNQIEDAFRFMSTGKHMGKVLIKIREDEDMFNTKLEKFSGIPRYLCYPHKTYVIIGGLGGFGLELTDWLIIRGAKNFVLTSRKGVSTGYQKMRLKIWSSYGVRIHISKEDICTEQGCRDMLKKANELGDVHAIFNLAVVLADSIFENQTDATFKTSFGPKAIATANLDNLSRILCPQLKDFVIFSSVTCGRGNAGQTNYGMANSVMERICEKRRKEGYAALAIQWGAIGDVGLVAELQEEHVELEIGGTLQQKIQSCLNVLNNFLRQNQATIVSSIVVAEKKGGLDSCDNIIDTVINILGLTDAKVVSHHATLPELGMDSMTGVEIKQTLEREFEVYLTPKDMKTLTLAKLKEIQEQKCLAVDKDGVDYLTMMINNEVGDEEEMNLTEIHLNPNLKSNNPLNILMFPGIEGFARPFKILSRHMYSKVIGLQYWDNISIQTVQELAQGLLPTVESYIKPNELFNFVGYSFGSLVALEVVRLLEEKGYIGNVTIVDGGPLFMKKIITQVMQDSDVAFETALLIQLMSYIMSMEKIVEHKDKFVNADSWEERINLARDIVFSIKPEAAVDHHIHFANGVYYRAKATANYIPSYEKLKSKIKLIKPSIKTVADIPDDFGLSQYSEHPVEHETLEGNHITILSNEQLAQVINAASTEKRKEV